MLLTLRSHFYGLRFPISFIGLTKHNQKLNSFFDVKRKRKGSLTANRIIIIIEEVYFMEKEGAL